MKSPSTASTGRIAMTTITTRTPAAAYWAKAADGGGIVLAPAQVASLIDADTDLEQAGGTKQSCKDDGF